MIRIADVAILEIEAMYIHCPLCNSVATIPIDYGKPTSETVEAGKHGLIYMAGCVIEDARFNRHCKACHCDFISDDDSLFGTRHDQEGFTITEMNRMLDNLESDLEAIHQDIERAYMRLGRETYESGNFEIFDLLKNYHSIWALFLARLQDRDDPIIVIGHDGAALARYSHSTARIYMVKMDSLLYWSLKDLAKACHRLGRASRGDTKDIDELKNATIELENARQKIKQDWQNFRVAATTYCEKTSA